MEEEKGEGVLATRIKFENKKRGKVTFLSHLWAPFSKHPPDTFKDAAFACEQGPEKRPITGPGDGNAAPRSLPGHQLSIL